MNADEDQAKEYNAHLVSKFPLNNMRTICFWCPLLTLYVWPSLYTTHSFFSTYILRILKEKQT